jgi:predicted dehydrogenase
MKFVIAGLGSIGRRHFRNLINLGERDIVLYRSHKSTLPDDELAGFPVETDLKAALAHKPDAVIISNPTALHLEVAFEAAEAGCHILIEKPVAHSHQGTEKLLTMMQENNLTGAVGYQFRFHPGLRIAYDLVKQGKLGSIVSAQAFWGEYLPGWHPWEDYRMTYAARADLGGGVVRTLCHPLDYLTWMFGPVKTVDASVLSTGQLGIDVDDLAEINFSFVNGTLGHIHLDYHRRPGSHTLSLIGTEGTLEWDNATGITRYLTTDMDQWREFIPAEGFERNTMFVSEMKNFLQAIKGVEKPACSIKEGIYDMRLVDAVYQSGEQHKVINLTEVDR